MTRSVAFILYLNVSYIDSMSRTLSQAAGKRALYGFSCPEISVHNSRGIFHNSDGMLYVK